MQLGPIVRNDPKQRILNEIAYLQDVRASAADDLAEANKMVAGGFLGNSVTYRERLAAIEHLINARIARL